MFNADQIVFYEHKGWHFGETRGLKNNVQINCAFMDSHVKTHTLVNAPATYTNDYNAPGEPNYYNFDNNQAMVRGTNPPAPGTPATYVDPTRFSDMLP